MIILASASPRRRALCAQIGLHVEVFPSAAAEEPFNGGDPAAYARSLALAKATEVAAAHPAALVVGADTVVVVGREVLGKPVDPADARRMLARLAGRRHRVISGLAVVHAAAGQTALDHAVTAVWIRSLTPDQIAAYVASGEPMDKAGAYAVQGRAAAMVERIDGCYHNVVGLPVALLVRQLAQFGVDLLNRGDDPWNTA